MQKELIEFEIPDLRFNIKTLEGNNSLNWRGVHVHTAVELIYVNKGELLCFTNDEKLKISGEKVLFINSGVPHRLDTDGEVKFTYIQLMFEGRKENSISKVFDFALRTENKGCYIAERDDVLLELYKDMCREAREKRDFFKECIKADITKLYAYLCRKGIITAPTEKAMGKINKILPVAEYIERNFDRNISLDELTALTELDKFTLCRKFKEATGGTIIEFLNYVRLRKAEGLLLYSDKNVSETAFLCGFSSIQYFNKVFKKYMGISPGKFKRM